MQLNWSIGILSYLLIGGLLSDYKVRKKLKDENEMKKLYDEHPSVLVNMLHNRALVFAMGCFIGLPGFIFGFKEKLSERSK